MEFSNLLNHRWMGPFIFWFQVETHNKAFAEKLETLLHRAYHLQEDFGSSIPTDSLLADFGKSQLELSW